MNVMNAGQPVFHINGDLTLVTGVDLSDKSAHVIDIL